MDKLIIKGGKKLSGEVTVSGSKNASLPIFVATLLSAGLNEISNVPFLRDINTTIKVLESLGARVEGNGNVVRIDTSGVNNHEATYDLVRTMRASVLVLVELAGRRARRRLDLARRGAHLASGRSRRGRRRTEHHHAPHARGRRRLFAHPPLAITRSAPGRRRRLGFPPSLSASSEPPTLARPGLLDAETALH